MSKLTGVKAVLADPKRLAKWKSNPGLRGKLPEKYLTPEQRLARRMGQEIFPGAGITGFEQARQAKSATDQVYGPQKLALQDQANTVAAQRQRNAGWWDQYVGQLRAMQAPAANTQAGPDVGAQYGAPAGPGTQQVQASAGGYQQALSSLAAGMLQNNVASGGQRKLESLAGLDAVELGVKQKQGALQKEADLFKQDQKDKIKSSARQTLLENIAYKIKQDTADSTIADKAADNNRDAKKWSGEVNKYGVTNGAWRDWGKTAGGKAKRQKAIDEYNAVTHPPKDPKDPKKKTPKAGEPGSPQRKDALDTANAVLRNQKTPWLDGKGNTVYTVNGKTVSVPKGGAAPDGAVLRQRPITPEYAKTHRQQLIDALHLKKKVPMDIAARAVDRFIASGGKPRVS